MSAVEEVDCEGHMFEAGEKVLCFHGPLIYESKCQQVRICEESKKPEYLIHYLGWNKNWDEWVPESRILKYNEINVKKQQELERAVSKVKERKSRRKGTNTESKNSDSSSQSSPSTSSQSSSNLLVEEFSLPRVVIERHLSTDESTPETSTRPELKEDGNGKTDDEQVHIKQEVNRSDDTCDVNVKIEDECITGSLEGCDTSSDKESKRISQRRSSRLSVESRTSSQEQETTIKEECDVLESSRNLIEESFENEKGPNYSSGKAEGVFPLTENNLKLKNTLIDKETLEKPADAAAKIERRRSSAKSENGSSSLENGSDKPKRRSSVDTKKSTSEEAQQKSSAISKENVDQFSTDPLKKPGLDKFTFKKKLKPYTFPKELKTFLLDDWDFITRQHKLCFLPAQSTMEKICKHFISMHDGVEKEEVEWIMSFLRSYFDVALGHRLLYKFERIQYGDILKLHPSKKMSEIYGGPHILRLINYMEENLEWSNMEEKYFDVCSKVMASFLQYLIQKSYVYCSSNVYYFATVDYHRADNLS
ncbi:hypothetical protein LSTR_LSTR002227 [Laodelphax striatellus]|uniref:Chromo domain-containing protein n=1 Tax=Laodelphax striatellus TaxID=195883 RepID=A0A482XFH4_LAOST|nr:hypothetical protein LSTR_LSTR002227 [Laodelphax striatellus]